MQNINPLRPVFCDRHPQCHTSSWKYGAAKSPEVSLQHLPVSETATRELERDFEQGHGGLDERGWLYTPRG